jgi:hypothetical protein
MILRTELDVSVHKTIKRIITEVEVNFKITLLINYGGIFLCTGLILLISLTVLSGFVEWNRLSILGKKRVNDDTPLLFLLSDVMPSILSILLGSHTRGTVSHAQLSIVIINYSEPFRHNRLPARHFSTCNANKSKVCGKKQKFNRYCHVW